MTIGTIGLQRWAVAALLAFTTCFCAAAVAQDDTATEQPAAEQNSDEEQPAGDPDTDDAAADDEPATDDGEQKDDEPKEDEPKDDEPKDDPAPELGPKAQAWEAKLTEWKTLLSRLRDLREQYEVAQDEDLEMIRTQYNELRAQGEKLLPELKTVAKAAFEEAPNEDRQLTRFMLKVAADEIREGRYEQGLAESEYLLKHDIEDNRVYDMAGIGAYATNKIELAKEYLDKASAEDVLTKDGTEAYERIEQFDLVKLWEEEQKIREAEAKADDLPRVKLKTTKGDIVIELFENEAPETVGNFISLVKKGFYDGRLFHRVIHGFMAQTGDPNGDGTGGPGYNIKCECYKDNARNHFAGSLSMAHAGKDTGGSQFYLTFKPTPHLNGRHTVFGRVVEGWDTLAKIQRYDPSGKDPKPPLDKIEEAEVLRLRESTDYKPTKVGS